MTIANKAATSWELQPPPSSDRIFRSRQIGSEKNPVTIVFHRTPDLIPRNATVHVKAPPHSSVDVEDFPRLRLLPRRTFNDHWIQSPTFGENAPNRRRTNSRSPLPTAEPSPPSTLQPATAPLRYPSLSPMHEPLLCTFSLSRG